MVLLIIIPTKWLFHWEYTQHFQTYPYHLKNVICLGVAGNGDAMGISQSMASHLRQESMVLVIEICNEAWVALLLWLFLGPEKMFQTLEFK